MALGARAECCDGNGTTRIEDGRRGFAKGVAPAGIEDFEHVLDAQSRRLMSSAVSSPRPISASAGPGAARAKARAANATATPGSPFEARGEIIRAVHRTALPPARWLRRTRCAHVAAPLFTTKAGYA